jgi:hypothetical protein
MLIVYDAHFAQNCASAGSSLSAFAWAEYKKPRVLVRRLMLAHLVPCCAHLIYDLPVRVRTSYTIAARVPVPKPGPENIRVNRQVSASFERCAVRQPNVTRARAALFCFVRYDAPTLPPVSDARFYLPLVRPKMISRRNNIAHPKTVCAKHRACISQNMNNSSIRREDLIARHQVAVLFPPTICPDWRIQSQGLVMLPAPQVKVPIRRGLHFIAPRKEPVIVYIRAIAYIA